MAPLSLSDLFNKSMLLRKPTFRHLKFKLKSGTKLKGSILRSHLITRTIKYLQRRPESLL